MLFSKIARASYRVGRVASDANAVERSVRTRSPKPVAKRLVRKAIGRALARTGVFRFPR